MTQQQQRFIFIAALLFIFCLGGALSWLFFAPKSNPVEESQVMLERIRTVMKLTTVEGQYSEMFSHNDYNGAFAFFWEKKMLVRVTATVAAGYDLEKVKIETDAQRKKIIIGPMPKPSILSVDDKIDYYDISEGIFTSFSPQDYTSINEKVEQIIRDKAQTTLLPSAEAQIQKTLELLKGMAASAGWELEIASWQHPN
jgi:hypothetical protein